MENAAEALKMAGSVLIFVVALSVCIMSFTQARQAIDSVVAFSDREYLTIENDDRFFYQAKGGVNDNLIRIVNKETIIPAIYRAYKENYKIVFKFPDSSYNLFITGSERGIDYIDLEEQVMGSDLDSRRFLDGILYRYFNYDYDGDGSSNDGKTKYEAKFNISLDGDSLYEYLSDKEKHDYNITEQLGTYYQEDLVKGEDGKRSISTKEDKTEKRVITYTLVAK